MLFPVDAKDIECFIIFGSYLNSWTEPGFENWYKIPWNEC